MLLLITTLGLPIRADPELEVVDEGQDREDPSLSVEEVRVEARPLAPRRLKAARKSTSKKSRPAVLRGSGRAGSTLMYLLAQLFLLDYDD